MDRSASSYIIEKSLKIFGQKKLFVTEENAKKYIDKQKRKNSKEYKIPKLYKNFPDQKLFFDNIPYYLKKGNKTIILYLHGGSFICRPLIFHWTFLKAIHEETNATIFLPLYPLAPKNTYKDTYKFLLNFYQFLLKSNNTKNIIIIGDSAGGTLTLGLTNLIREKRLPLPSKLIVLSPALDVTFNNELIPKYEKYDPMLSQVGCSYICWNWARGSEWNNPLISPKFINYYGFPDTYLFFGTHEILYPELKLFVNKYSNKKRFKLIFFEGKKLNHVFPLFPTPEGLRARKKIIKIIKKSN